MKEYHLSGFRIAGASGGRGLVVSCIKRGRRPIGEFCLICQQEGYDIYPMDIIQAGDEFYATMKRSTNGGGENSPVLTCEDDAYELFFAGLETDN